MTPHRLRQTTNPLHRLSGNHRSWKKKTSLSELLPLLRHVGGPEARRFISEGWARWRKLLQSGSGSLIQLVPHDQIGGSDQRQTSKTRPSPLGSGFPSPQQTRATFSLLQIRPVFHYVPSFTNEIPGYSKSHPQLIGRFSSRPADLKNLTWMSWTPLSLQDCALRSSGVQLTQEQVWLCTMNTSSVICFTLQNNSSKSTEHVERTLGRPQALRQLVLWF